jgi:hypothetical protein
MEDINEIYQPARIPFPELQYSTRKDDLKL